MNRRYCVPKCADQICWKTDPCRKTSYLYERLIFLVILRQISLYFLVIRIVFSKFTLKNTLNQICLFMSNKTRKYKINDFLLRLPVHQYREAVKIIPRVLGVSLNTFHNYRNILWNDKQDIPHEKVIMFEKLFELEGGELINKEIKCKPLSELMQKDAGKVKG